MNTFSYLYWPLVLFLLRILCVVHLPIYFGGYFFLVLSFLSSFFILDGNPLSEEYTAKIFFHSVGCLFTLLFPLFTEAFNLEQSHLLVPDIILCESKVLYSVFDCSYGFKCFIFSCLLYYSKSFQFSLLMLSVGFSYVVFTILNYFPIFVAYW